jgi:hypothetical protein
LFVREVQRFGQMFETATVSMPAIPAAITCVFGLCEGKPA